MGPNMLIIPARGLLEGAGVAAGLEEVVGVSALLPVLAGGETDPAPSCDIMGPSMLIMPASGLLASVGAGAAFAVEEGPVALEEEFRS